MNGQVRTIGPSAATAESSRRSTAFSSLVFHAERLHDPKVWKHVDCLLRRLEEQGTTATLFVHPFWANHEGQSIAEQLDELLARGHEIGQHTHYYSRPAPLSGSFLKRTDLSDRNVRACLDADYEYLRKAGVNPRGFTAGGWEKSDAASEWLADHNFLYDCTARSYVGRSAGSRTHSDARIPSNLAGVLDLPTTMSVSRYSLWPKLWKNKFARVGAVSYAMAYVHDYDLVRWGKRIAVRACTTWLASSGRTMHQAQDIARLARPEPSDATTSMTAS